MYFGAHVSVAGGLENAPKNAAKIGCEVFQMFTRPPQGGPASKITDEVIKKFKDECEKAAIKEYVVHTPYYINLASGQERIRQNSVRIIRDDLERASLLGAKYCMFHPGSGRDLGEKTAIQKIIEGLKEILKDYSGSCQLLLEISAGTGDIIGDTFEEVSEIIKALPKFDLGVCFDTQHAFASGYDLRDSKSAKATLKDFDELIGLDKLKVIHCNDSMVDLGAKKDRHAHLGQGKIGRDGFEALVKEKKLADIDFYLETDPNGVALDLALLKELRGN
ncbi:MAG: deoxyribonuclease IV [bacterium]